MPVIAGLAIAKGAPNRAGAMALIEHLTKPETQVLTAAEVGFFPVVNATLPADLPPGVKLLADGIAKTQTAQDALVALAAGRARRQGRRVQQGLSSTRSSASCCVASHAKAVLDAAGRDDDARSTETKAPCWAPDKPSEGPCPVK